MKTTPCISESDAYIASEADVLPVDAHPTFLAPHHPRVRERGGHSVVLEAARRIQAFVLQQQVAGLDAHLLGEQRCVLELRAAFADGDDVVFGSIKREEFAGTARRRRNPPDRGVGALGRPAVLELLQTLRHGQPRPVVLDVEQAAAFRACDLALVDSIGGGARGINAQLGKRVQSLRRQGYENREGRFNRHAGRGRFGGRARAGVLSLFGGLSSQSR